MNHHSLTVGFATYDDARGAAFTIQHLRLFHSEVHSRLELVVVDNHPDSPAGARVKSMCQNVKEFPCKYEAFPEPVGTSAPRQRVFEIASGDAVLCMDSHVMVPPGALSRLLAYYDLRPKTRDLLSGPMLYDNLMPEIAATHFDNSWGGEMWGRWGTAWRRNGALFSIAPDENGRCVPRYLFDEFPLEPARVKREFPDWPDLEHCAHQERFLKLGFRLAAGYDIDPPFEIPAMGLGLFTCRREAWLGFNSNFRGFGGEEWYIHEKFRKAGAKCLCLPFLKWWHFFAYELPGYAKHLTMWNKIRNYVIGHAELGLPMDRLRKEFEGKIPEPLWQVLLMNPKNPPGMGGG